MLRAIRRIHLDRRHALLPVVVVIYVLWIREVITALAYLRRLCRLSQVFPRQLCALRTGHFGWVTKTLGQIFRLLRRVQLSRRLASGLSANQLGRARQVAHASAFEVDHVRHDFAAGACLTKVGVLVSQTQFCALFGREVVVDLLSPRQMQDLVLDEANDSVLVILGQLSVVNCIQ
jgi:hypothetical protein